VRAYRRHKRHLAVLRATQSDAEATARDVGPRDVGQINDAP
jgi:hypothetical protein